MSNELGPFAFVKSISVSKVPFTDEEIEKYYNPYITTRTFANFMDTVLYANEINTIGVQVSKRQHFDFFFNVIKKRSRYTENIIKDEKRIAKIKTISEYFNYSTRKSEDVLALFSDDQIKEMDREMNFHGGVIGKTKSK